MNSNQIIISICEWDKLNLDELAEFTFTARQSTPETFNSERTIERERRIINFLKQFKPSFVVVARKRNKMLGWLSFDISSTSIMEIGRWLPVVLPDESEDSIISSLISQCKKYCKTINYPRIEVSFNISDGHDKQAYEIYRKWYETNDIQNKDEISYMLHNLSESDITDISIPETFETKIITEINNDEVYRCYYQAFIQAEDRMFQDQTKKERRDYFIDYYSLSKPFIKEASLVLKKVDTAEIVGATLVRPRGEEAHLALLMIHPNYQGRKLGKMLLKLTMNTVFRQGFKSISLGVDIENPAMKIYQNMGFVTNSHIITHCWNL
ncbi:MAG: GNAT family N-acetyltransferase [Candidatus Hodarchaeales archaeon]|jgi:ribosomal protein S18 acetylase RimI-like enzyme